MTKMVTFRHKSNGVIADYPEHYAKHPVFGFDLERYTPGDDDYEEDKVVQSNEIPVEQRAIKTATPKEDKPKDAATEKKAN